MNDINAVYEINGSERGIAICCTVVAHNAKDWKVICGGINMLNCSYFYENYLSAVPINDYIPETGVTVITFLL